MANDGDERDPAPIPLVPPPPPLPPPSGAVEAGLDLGHVPDAQRLQPPSADAQRLQPDTSHGRQFGRESVDPQRAPSNLDAQRNQPHLDAQRADPSAHPADVQREAGNVQRTNRVGRARSLRHLRPRTRFLLASAAAVAAGGSTVLIVSAQGDDKPAVAPATVAVTVPTTDPAVTVAATTEAAAAPVETAAPTTATETTATETTLVETTLAATTVVETTLVPTTLAPSVAGLYTVTVSNAVISSSVTGDLPLPQQPADQWSLEGPCDGIGTCTMSLASSVIGPGATDPSSISFVVLSPSGPNTYAGTVDLTADAPGCGTGTGDFSVTTAPGGFSGTYIASFTGSGADCPPFTVTAEYAGTLTG